MLNVNGIRIKGEVNIITLSFILWEVISSHRICKAKICIVLDLIIVEIDIPGILIPAIVSLQYKVIIIL